MFPLRLIGQAGNLGEGLEREVFREEREGVFQIQRAVPIDGPLDGLQLGSGSVDVDVSHSGLVDIELVRRQRVF